MHWRQDNFYGNVDNLPFGCPEGAKWKSKILSFFMPRLSKKKMVLKYYA